MPSNVESYNWLVKTMELKEIPLKVIKTETEGTFDSPIFIEYLTYFFFYSEIIKWRKWENIAVFGPVNKEIIESIQGTCLSNLFYHLDTTYSALHIDLDQAIEFEKLKV